MLPYCGPCNVLTVACLYSSVPPVPTNVDMCVEKSFINSDIFIHPHVSWPHATIWELSVNRLQSEILCVSRELREIEVILVWTQLLATACVGRNPHSSVSTLLHCVLNKDLCLFRVSSVALHHNRAPADYLWLWGGQWFMTVFLLLYASPLLQLSAAVNLYKLP